MRKDLDRVIAQINDSKTLAMRLAVGGNINGDIALEVSANKLYDLLEDAYLHAIKIRRLADEA